MNEKSKFTPGPWKYKNERIYSEDDPTGATIAYCKEKRNGKLIEKAPEMFSILISAAWRWDYMAHDLSVPLCERKAAEENYKKTAALLDEIGRS